MKVIQLRGTNATGKTTTIRQFIERGNFTVETIRVGIRDIEYHWDSAKKIAIVGRYDKRMSGGVDGYIAEKKLLQNVILRMVTRIRPEVLLFEGIVYGVTFQFAYELSSLLKKLKCEYIGLCFLPPLDVVFDRLAERNGGKPVDYMSVQNKWFTARRSYEMLRKAGVEVREIDTSKIPKDKMWKIIQEEL